MYARCNHASRLRQNGVLLCVYMYIIINVRVTYVYIIMNVYTLQSRKSPVAKRYTRICMYVYNNKCTHNIYVYNYKCTHVAITQVACGKAVYSYMYVGI